MKLKPGSSPKNLEHKTGPEMGVLEEIVKNAVKLGSIVDLVKHLARLHPLIAHYVKVNLGMINFYCRPKELCYNRKPV